MVSFVIPHYDAPESLALLLQSIEYELQSRDGFEVIIVDDASFLGQQKTLEILKNFPNYKLIVNSKNCGAAFSRNRGALAATNEWIWFVDADVTLCSGALSKQLELIKSGFDFQGIINGVSLACDSPNPFMRYKNYLEASWHPPEGETLIVDSKSFLVKRSVFLKVGGFDETITGAGVEDYELGYRMRNEGYRLYFSRQVQITHAHHRFFKQAKIFYKRARDWVALKSRYGVCFDDCGSTLAEGVSQLISASILTMFIIAPIKHRSLLVAGVFSFFWLALNLNKIKVAKKAGEKPSFLALHVIYSLLLSVPVVAGASAGVVYSLGTITGIRKKSDSGK